MAGKKGRSGRLPDYRPKPEHAKQVEVMAAIGLTYETMTKIIGCGHVKNLKKHFPDQLAFGRGTINCMAAVELIKKIQAGEMAAITFWLSRRGGNEWKEKTTVEYQGKVVSEIHKIIDPVEAQNEYTRLMSSPGFGLEKPQLH